MDLLTATDIGVTYQGITAVRNASINVAVGELVGLVGSNGAGKSSLLAAVCGPHRPITGTVKFDGIDITTLPTHDIARHGIALVPEGRRLFGHQSVRANLALGSHLLRDRVQRRQREEQVLTMFPVLRDRLNQQARLLSGGEQQMLALARALMRHPRLLVLDEPTLGIAPTMVIQLLDAIRHIRHDGVSVLLVEQNVRAALQLADRLYVLQNGAIVLHGTSREIERSDLVRTAYLGI